MHCRNPAHGCLAFSRKEGVHQYIAFPDFELLGQRRTQDYSGKYSCRCLISVFISIFGQFFTGRFQRGVFGVQAVNIFGYSLEHHSDHGFFGSEHYLGMDERSRSIHLFHILQIFYYFRVIGNPAVCVKDQDMWLIGQNPVLEQRFSAGHDRYDSYQYHHAQCHSCHREHAGQ